MINFFFKKRIQQNPVSIISNDCWGGQFYRHFGLEYSTPFVGLYMYAPCFIDFVCDFSFNIMSEDIKQIHQSKYKEANEYRNSNNLTYPIGQLNDKMEIHFLHYKNWSEAIEKWEQRKSRINFENLLFKFDASKDLANETLLQTFLDLNFKKKIVLSKGENITYSGCVLKIPNWTIDGAKMYKISIAYFDIMTWVNTGVVKNTIINKFWFKYFVKQNNRLL